MVEAELDKLDDTHQQGKYYCTADLLFGRIGFGQTIKFVSI